MLLEPNLHGIDLLGKTMPAGFLLRPVRSETRPVVVITSNAEKEQYSHVEY
jgi:hypothetical protein